MVKNVSGGSKHKKQKNNTLKETRPLVLKSDETDYGQIITILGGSWVTVRKLGTERQFRCRLGHARGMGKMSKLDIVLFAVREYQSKPIGDILVIYNLDEVNILKKDKHIPDDVVVDDLFVNEDEDIEDGEIDSEERNANKLVKELDIKDKRANKEELNNEEIDIDNI